MTNVRELRGRQEKIQSSLLALGDEEIEQFKENLANFKKELHQDRGQKNEMRRDQRICDVMKKTEGLKVTAMSYEVDGDRQLEERCVCRSEKRFGSLDGGCSEQ